LHDALPISRRVDKQIGGRLAASDLAGAEDPAREAVVEPGESKRKANLLVGPARRDTRRYGDRVECLDDAGHRLELGGESVAIQMLERLFPARAERTAQVSLDLGGHLRVAPAHESLDDLRLGHRPAQPGEPGDVVP